MFTQMDLSSLNLQNKKVATSKTISETTNNRSEFLKRMRSNEHEDLLNPNLTKTQYSDSVMQQGSIPLLSLSTGPQTKMLSFSNSGSDSHSLIKNDGFDQSSEFSHFNVTKGYVSGVPVMENVGGAFTASQWIELQHQALVYKYIQANVTVPSSLLLGIKRSVSPYLFSGLPTGSYSYTPNSWGWGGSFHLGFSGNSTDPEPGRCRRTDGKKWRCSRDAVVEHKYCERHLNRGRNRSRKLVEGRAGQSAAVGKASTATSAAMSASVILGRAVPEQSQQLKGLQTCAIADDPSTYNMKFNRIGDDNGLPALNPTAKSDSKDSIFSLQQQHTTTHDHSHSDFGYLSSDSFLNPSNKTPYMNTTTTFDPIIPFMNGSDRATWPEEMKQDWTQLSMSIPTRDKMTLPPLNLFHESDQNNISWGNTMGGPLGEVLLNKTSSSWSSPTGVLQKGDFRSLSNSSNGSSPRGEGRMMEGCEDVFGTHLTTSMFLPSL